jgi:hypothetical protein
MATDDTDISPGETADDALAYARRAQGKADRAVLRGEVAADRAHRLREDGRAARRSVDRLRADRPDAYDPPATG